MFSSTPNAFLWHPQNVTLIEKLYNALPLLEEDSIAPSSFDGSVCKVAPHQVALQRRILSLLLPLVLRQFAPELVALKDDALPSSRLECARSLLLALNFSLFLDGASDEVGTREKKEDLATRNAQIRLLLLFALQGLCQRLERNKLEALLTTTPMTCRRNHKALFIPVAEQVTKTAFLDIFARAVLSFMHDDRPLVHIACAARRNKDIWLARSAHRNLLWTITSSMTTGSSGQAWQLLNDYGTLILRGLRHGDRKSLDVDCLKARLCAYADLTQLVLSFNRKSCSEEHLNLLSHPLLLLRHVVVSMIRLTIWNIEIADYSAKLFERIAGFLETEFSNASDSRTAGYGEEGLRSISPSVGRHLAGLLKILADFFEVCLVGSGSSKRDVPLVPLVSDTFCSKLTQWALSRHTVKMVQLYMVPIIEQLATIEENWDLCERMILSLCSGHSSPDASPITQTTHDAEHQTTFGYLLKWLINRACSRETVSTDNAESLRSGKLPSAEAIVRLRIFCVRILERIPSSDHDIVVCLLSLFDDRSVRVRIAVAQAIAMRSMNYQTWKGHHKDDAYAKHSSVGACVCRDLAAYRSSAERAYGLLLKCFDGLEKTAPKRQLSFLGCITERHTFGLWAKYITEHYLLICPGPGTRMKANAKCRPLSKFVDQLVRRWDAEVKNTLELAQPTTSMQEAIAIVCSTLVEGVGVYARSLPEEAPFVMVCEVLRACSPLLRTLRVASSWALRALFFETCLKILKSLKVQEELLGTTSERAALNARTVIRTIMDMDADLSVNVQSGQPSDWRSLDNHPKVAFLKKSVYALCESRRNPAQLQSSPRLRAVDPQRPPINIGAPEQHLNIQAKRIRRADERGNQNTRAEQSEGLGEELQIIHSFYEHLKEQDEALLVPKAASNRPAWTDAKADARDFRLISDHPKDANDTSSTHALHVMRHKFPPEGHTYLEEGFLQVVGDRFKEPNSVLDVPLEPTTPQPIRPVTGLDLSPVDMYSRKYLTLLDASSHTVASAHDAQRSLINLRDFTPESIKGETVIESMDDQQRMLHTSSDTCSTRNDAALHDPTATGGYNQQSSDGEYCAPLQTISEVDAHMNLNEFSESDVDNFSRFDDFLNGVQYSYHFWEDSSRHLDVDDHISETERQSTHRAVQTYDEQKHHKHASGDGEGDVAKSSSPDRKIVDNFASEQNPESVKWEPLAVAADLSDLKADVGITHEFQRSGDAVMGSFEVPSYKEEAMDSKLKGDSDGPGATRRVSNSSQRGATVSSPGLRSTAPDTSNLQLASFSLLSPLPNAPAFLRSRLRKALEVVLNLLVFHQSRFRRADYRRLFREESAFVSTNKVGVLSDSDSDDADTSVDGSLVIKEALHPVLRKVFKLEPTLLVDICMKLDFDESKTTPQNRGRRYWVPGIAQLHRQLLPISRIIHELEYDMQSPLSVAQALVLVKDQVTLDKMTTGAGHLDGASFIKTAIARESIEIINGADSGTGKGSWRLEKTPFLQWISSVG